MDPKKRLFQDETAYKILKKARLHLMAVPYLLFFISLIGSTIISFYFKDSFFILLGFFTGFIFSQFYWSRMTTVWLCEAISHKQYPKVFREALNEGLVYPRYHFLNNFIISTSEERKQIDF